MRKLTSKISLVLSLAMLLSVMLAACGTPQSTSTTGSTSAPSGASTGQTTPTTLNISLKSNPTILDPIMFRDRVASSVILSVHEPLYRFDESGYGYEPGLAESYETNEDNSVWTFTLREGALWSDGTPVTPEDVIYSFQRPLNPEMGSPNVNDFFIIKNAQAIYSSRASENSTPLPYEDLGVIALPGNKVQITLERPIDYFLDFIRISFFAPVQKKAAEEWGELYGTDFDKVVSSGPYLLTEWQHESSLTLEKNPNYWDADAVQTTTIEIVVASDANTVMSMYDTDALDVMLIDQITANSGKYSNVHEVVRLNTQIIQFNSHAKIDGVAFNYFQNAKIREALALTFDRQAYCNEVIQQPKGAAYGLVPSGMRGSAGDDFREQQGDLVYDISNFPGGEIDGKTYSAGKDGAVQRANDLFEEGLAECGKTKQQFENEAEFVLPNSASTITNCQAMQAMWKEHLGINVMMKPLEMANLMPYIIEGTYQCLIGGGPTGSTYDPGEFLSFIYNEKQWENEEYNKLWEKSLTLTGDERIEVIKQCEKMACDAYLYIPVTFAYENYVIRETVTGLRQFSVGLDYDFKYVKIG